MKVEIFDIRMPEHSLMTYSASNIIEANNIGRSEIVSAYIDACRTQGFILGRYDFRVKNDN